MANIERLELLLRKLQERSARAREDSKASAVVGYTAAYALYVHENREAKLKGQPRPSGLGVYWGPSLYGPNYLVGPLRQFQKILAGIVVGAVRGGQRLAQGLLLAGLRLQRESQLRVPVEYGNLRASAFTRLE